jgi:hypothetical protein
MDMVLSRQWIASAFLVNEGPHGAVSEHARRRGVSRQRVYRESHWVHTRVHAPQWQAQQRLLRDQVAALEGRVAKLEAELGQTRRVAVVLDANRQAEFASVGQAIGVSLPELRQLLQVLLGQETPSVAKLGRMTKAAAEKAGAILEVLDEVAKPLVEVAAADEIYTKAPVLMVVEPESLCWVKGQKVESVRGQAWCEVFAELPNLRMVLRDAGTGLSHGVDLANDQRTAEHTAERVDIADEPRTIERVAPLLAQQDHFHSLREGARGLGRAERVAKAAFAKVEKMQKELEQRRRHGQLLSGFTTQVNAQWRRAEKAFDVWSERSRLWNQVKDALRLVTPEGELNTPARAEQAVRQAMAALPDADFGKSKRQLQEPETYTYLHEVQRQLAALPVPAEVRDAAVRIECLRRRPELLQGESTQAAALRALLLVSAVVLAKSHEVGVEAAKSVRSIFRSAWRASSLVECLNSVLRMQQARHRNLSQNLLDLKRLYWNSHAFRTGRRRGKSPYEHLGVHLPEGVTWWNLLKWPPEQLRQELSARRPGP